MAKEQMKLVFNSDYSPRQKGEVAVFKGPEEIKTAEWYIANGIASECDCAKDTLTGKGCTGCDEAAALAKGNAPDTGQNNTAGDLVIGTQGSAGGTGAPEGETLTAGNAGDNPEGSGDPADKTANAPDTIKAINEMATVDEVKAALEGETRTTVIAAGNKRIEALSADKEI